MLRLTNFYQGRINLSPEMDDKLLYKIALSVAPGIGGILARNTVAYIGSVEGVFSESLKSLQKIPGIGEINAKRIKDKDVLVKAERELKFIEKNEIDVQFYTDKNFPRRLKPVSMRRLSFTPGVI